MKVNKQRYELAVKAMEELAGAGTQFTFDEFCKENGLYGQHDRKRLDGVFISCPFHREDKPSLFINEDKRKWNCFGCSTGGDYLEFITKYDTEVLGQKVTRAAKLNELLHTNNSLRAKVDFDTVFDSEQPHSKELQTLSFRKFTTKQQVPKTYLELASTMQKSNCSVQSIKYAISLMQGGITPEVIFEQLRRFSQSAILTKSYSLVDLSKDAD